MIPAGCAPREPDSPPTVTPAVSSRLLLQAITSPSEAFFVPVSSGWTLEGSPRIVSPDSLEAYLGQDASHYRLFGLLDLVVSNYVNPPEGLEVTVEVFRFDGATNAFGAYSTNRPEDATTMKLGDGAWLGRYAIHVLSDRYLLRVIGSKEQTSTVVRLVEDFAARIPTTGHPPEPLNIFPTENRIAESERFVRGPAFGQNYLRASWLVDYQVGDSHIEALLHEAGGESTVAERLARYRQFFETNGRLLDPIPGLGDESFTGEDRLIGRAVVWRIGQELVAIQGIAPISDLERLAREILALQRARPTTDAIPPQDVRPRTRKEEASGT